MTSDRFAVIKQIVRLIGVSPDCADLSGSVG